MKVKKIIILSLVGILFFGACYAFYHEQQLNEETETVLSESEKQKIAETLKEKVDDDEGELYFVSHQSKDINDVKKFIKTLSNQEILSYLLANTDDVSYDDYSSFKASELRKTANKLFGDINYTNEDIKCNVCGDVLFKYNEGSSKYSYNSKHAGHGGLMGFNIYNYLESYDYQNGVFSIIVKKIFTDENFEFNAGYSSYNDAYEHALIKSNDKCLNENDAGMVEYSDKCYEKYKDKLNKYEYQFKKTDNTYQLLSYKIIKD